MKKLILSSATWGLFLLLAACGGGSSNPPATPTVPLTNLTPAQAADVQAQLTAMQQKFQEAQQICTSQLAPQFSAAITAYQQSPTTFAAVPPAGASDCYRAAGEALMTYKTALNGAFANSAAGQSYVAGWAQALGSSLSGGQTLPPAVAAAMIMPTYNQFSSTLNPAIASALGSATGGFLNPAAALTSLEATSTLNGGVLIPNGLATTGGVVVPNALTSLAGTTANSSLLSALQASALASPLTSAGLVGTTGLVSPGLANFSLRSTTSQTAADAQSGTSSAAVSLKAVNKTSSGQASGVYKDPVNGFETIY